MSRLVEMLIERPSAHIYKIPADLAGELDAQAVEFVEPVWDGFAVPGEGELEGVVDFVVARVRVGVCAVLVLGGEGGVRGKEGFEFHGALAVCHAGFALDVDAGVGADGFERGGEAVDAVFAFGDGAFFEAVYRAASDVGMTPVRGAIGAVRLACFDCFEMLLAGEVGFVDVIVFEFFFTVGAPDAFACAFCVWCSRTGALGVRGPACNFVCFPCFFEIGVDGGEEFI